MSANSTRCSLEPWPVHGLPVRDPASESLVVDLDSTICEVHGKAKQAAGYGYTEVLGYHPLLATRAGHR